MDGGLSKGSKEDRSTHILSTIECVPDSRHLQSLKCFFACVRGQNRKFNEMYSGWRRDNDASEESFWAEVRCVSELKQFLERTHGDGRGYASTTDIANGDLLDTCRYARTCTYSVKIGFV